VPLAFGSDTGGSVRVPAAFCGIFGLRLTPRDPWIAEGGFPLSPTLDTAGWFTRSAADMRIAITALVQGNKGRAGLKGVYFGAFDDKMDSELRQSCQSLVTTLTLGRAEPFVNALASASEGIVRHYSAIVGSEAWGIHKDWLDRYRDQYDPIVWRRIDSGRHWSAADIDAAHRQLKHIQSLFADLFQDYDFLAMPATPIVAPLNGPLSDDLRTLLLQFTAPGSFSGRPILTVPVRLKNGLSGGMQFIYRSPEDATPLRILELLESLSPPEHP
jgi:amidase/aspartyl-tRNA(Asn)/glutamyl-tRNA(Gln) amidotransferase subunit A